MEGCLSKLLVLKPAVHGSICGDKQELGREFHGALPGQAAASNHRGGAAPRHAKSEPHQTQPAGRILQFGRQSTGSLGSTAKNFHFSGALC